MTQPPLSMAIAQLEQELGSRLFNRNSRGVTLTVSGHYLAAEAEQILNTLEDVALRVRALEQGREGSLTVGVVPAAAWYLVPEVLRKFADRVPGVDVKLRERAPSEVVDATISGAFDVGFVVTSSAERLQLLHEGQLHVEQVTSLAIIVALGPQFAEFSDPIELSRLSEIPFAVPVRSLRVRGLQESLSESFESAGLPLPRIIDTFTLQEALPLVFAGLAAAAIPESIRYLVREESLVLRNLKDGPDPFHVALLYRDERSLSPAARKFVEVVREWGIANTGQSS